MCRLRSDLGYLGLCLGTGLVHGGLSFDPRLGYHGLRLSAGLVHYALSLLPNTLSPLAGLLCDLLGLSL